MSTKAKPPQQVRKSLGAGTLDRIDAIDFHCNGVLIQACNGYLYFWLDGDTSHQPDAEINITVLNRIIKVHEEQVDQPGDRCGNCGKYGCDCFI